MSEDRVALEGVQYVDGFGIMEGQIDEVVEGLITHYQAEALKATA